MKWAKVVNDWMVMGIIGFAVLLILASMLGFFEPQVVPDGFTPEDFSGEQW